MKKIFLVILLTALLFSFWTCKKQEGQTVSEDTMPKSPIIDAPASAPGHEVVGKKTEFKVVVPSEIKEQWTAVKFIVEDKEKNKKQEVTVNIGEKFVIPDSNLTVKTGPFLPDFKMSGQIITSASGDPKNPAVGVTIYEDGKKIFPLSGQWGWLYTNFPTIHSFQHERYGLTLQGGIKKQ